MVGQINTCSITTSEGRNHSFNDSPINQNVNTRNPMSAYLFSYMQIHSRAKKQFRLGKREILRGLWQKLQHCISTR